MEVKAKGSHHFYLRLTASIAALGGFLFGYDTGVISGALMYIQQSYPMTTFTQEAVVSAVVLGALFGALGSGRLADHYGSRLMLICMAITFIIGTIISFTATNVATIIIGRLIIGVAIGITSYLSPLFISEMAPAKKRGKLVLLNGVMIAGGEAIAFLVDYLLVDTQSWRVMFATGLIPALLLLIGMLYSPPSPRWMMKQGQHEKVREILLKTRPATLVEAEYNEIIQNSKQTKSHLRELFTKTLRPALLVGLGLGILQQFVGINTVMYYGPTIFKAAGFTQASTQILATFCMGVINTITSLIAVLIVDKIGRRKLLLGGMALSAVSLTLVSFIFNLSGQSISTAWITLVLMMLYIAGYSLSVGSLFWLIISEIYPLNIRGMAMSFVTAIQWAANFVIAMSFLSILNHIGPSYTFLTYASMCCLSMIFTYYLVPETRGITLEKIEHNLRLGKRSRDLGLT